MKLIQKTTKLLEGEGFGGSEHDDEIMQSNAPDDKMGIPKNFTFKPVPEATKLILDRLYKETEPASENDKVQIAEIKKLGYRLYNSSESSAATFFGKILLHLTNHLLR